MNLLVGALLLTLVVGVAIACLYVLRRRAPAGGFYADVDRAGAMFGVVGTASGGNVPVPCDARGKEAASS
jgi:hypothetical protein